MLLAAAVSASAGGGPPAASARELAAQRYADVIHRMRYKVQDREHPATAAEIEAVAPVALALGEDLTDPTVTWSEKRVALQALQHLRHAGRPAIPALVEALDLYPENNGPQGVGHFCEVTRTLAEVDPRDERGIRAVSGWLQQVRGGSICHRCGCALQLLEAAGPEARPIAGPVLEQFARGRVIMSDDFQLGKTLKAVGVSGAMAATLMERVIDSGVSPEDRAGTLKALAQDAGQLLEADRAELARISALLLAHHRYRPLREAAAEALGVLGPPGLDPLRLALKDADYRVRAKPAEALARLGPAAARAAPELVEALDPFRGTAREAAAALVAIGPLASPVLEDRARHAPEWLRPLIIATVRAIESGNPQLAHDALKRFKAGPGGHGFVRIEVRRRGSGPTFVPTEHRATLHVKGGAMGPGSEGLPRFDHTVDERAPNMVFHALAGQREGDRVHVVLSPEIAQSPLAGTGRWMDEEKLKFAVPEGVAAAYDVEIDRVCQPVIWRPLRGMGKFSDMQFEVFCRRPTNGGAEE
jgi:HEAT repeat protein